MNGWENILKKFLEIFPQFESKIDKWVPYGKGSIKICLKSKIEIVFYYRDPKRWTLQTIDEFYKFKRKGD